MGLLSVVLSLVLFSVQLSRAQDDPLLPFSEHLDSEHKVRLKWGFDEIQGTILFQLTVNTSGWVGFGFSPKGGMTGADIVIGGVGPSGSYFSDRYAERNSMPVIDQQQNYTLLSLNESDGQTVMKFQRSIQACDEYDLSITTLPIKLIYAYGQTDDIMYHGTRRGTKEVNLLRYMPRLISPDSKYFDMIMVNFTVPADQTYYHCKIMGTPGFDQKQHIYRIEPLIRNLDLVHHLLLYRCPPSVTEVYESRCYTGVNNDECMEVVAVWGVGGGPFEFPSVAGLPIGGNVSDVLYRLEVHYNNPNKIAGRVDNSGLRFFYTSNLRQHDAAILGTGLVVAPGYAIPPQAKDFLTYGLCDTAYIPQVLSETPQDFQVFSVMLHTHLAGRKNTKDILRKVGKQNSSGTHSLLLYGHKTNTSEWVPVTTFFKISSFVFCGKSYRFKMTRLGGKQIDLLAVDENYNFEYQGITNLGKTKTVKLGDKLLVECVYNTENRTKVTWGGLSTTDEMCLAFLFYYPATTLTGCMSYPNLTALRTEMGKPDLNNWLMMMSTMAWNDTSINQYQQTMKKIDQFVIVSNSHKNMSRNIGKIPDLKVSPSTPCMSGCDSERHAWILLLVSLAVLWAN